MPLPFFRQLIRRRNVVLRMDVAVIVVVIFKSLLTKPQNVQKSNRKIMRHLTFISNGYYTDQLLEEMTLIHATSSNN